MLMTVLTRQALALTCLFALAGCTGAEPEQSSATHFDYRSIHDRQHSISLIEAATGAPIQGAKVMIISPFMELPPTPPVTYAQGFTSADGSFEGAFRLPAHVDEVDVLVLKRGFQGAYSHPELLERWGPYAPASRQTVSLETTASMQIPLSRQEVR